MAWLPDPKGKNWKQDYLSPQNISFGPNSNPSEIAEQLKKFLKDMTPPASDSEGDEYQDPASDSDNDSDADNVRHPHPQVNDNNVGRFKIKVNVKGKISGYELECIGKFQLVWTELVLHGPPVLVLDCSRRSGDALLFGAVFKVLRAYFQALADMVPFEPYDQFIAECQGRRDDSGRVLLE